MDSKPLNIPRQPRIIRRIKYGTDKFILVRNTRIHYVEAGKGDTIILLPGSGSTYRIWNRLIPLLAEKYRILALDHSGLRDPDKPGKNAEENPAAKTDLIARMVCQMKLDKVNLVGISMAGAIAFDFASRYPDLISKIVSIDGYITKVEKNPGILRKSLRKIRVSRHSSIDIEEEAKSVKAPVLYLYGTKTNYREIPLQKNLEFLQTYLPQAWIVGMEGGIFELAMQKPEELSSLVLEFLSKR